VVSNSAQRSFCEVYRTIIFMLASGERTPQNCTRFTKPRYIIVKQVFIRTTAAAR